MGNNCCAKDQDEEPSYMTMNASLPTGLEKKFSDEHQLPKYENINLKANVSLRSSKGIEKFV